MTDLRTELAEVEATAAAAGDTKPGWVERLRVEAKTNLEKDPPNVLGAIVALEVQASAIRREAEERAAAWGAPASVPAHINPEYAEALIEALETLSADDELKRRHLIFNGEVRRFSSIAGFAAKQIKRLAPSPTPEPQGTAPDHPQICSHGIRWPRNETHRRLNLNCPKCVRHEPPEPQGDDEDEVGCGICDNAFIDGDRVIEDVEMGTVHLACCGPEREGFVKDLDTGDPLGPDDPIPTGYVWHPAPQGDEISGCAEEGEDR